MGADHARIGTDIGSGAFRRTFLSRQQYLPPHPPLLRCHPARVKRLPLHLHRPTLGAAVFKSLGIMPAGSRRAPVRQVQRDNGCIPPAVHSKGLKRWLAGKVSRPGVLLCPDMYAVGANDMEVALGPSS